MATEEAWPGTDDASPVRAAGAVLWRERAGVLQLALVHRPKYDDWSLPKGKVEPGEHITSTALREVREETGVRTVLGRPLGDQHYLADGRPKVVTYWAAEAHEGSHVPDREIDVVEWLEVDAARSRLTWERDRDLVDALVAGPRRTRALLLLRHADAVPRGDWSGSDDARPLTLDGHRQAEAVVPRLQAFGRTLLVSSPSLRCLQTLDPLTRELHLDVHEETGLRETDADLAAATVLDQLAAVGSTGHQRLVCTHRPVLPAVLAAVGAHAAVPVDASEPAPAELAVAHIDRTGTVVGFERHPFTG